MYVCCGGFCLHWICMTFIHEPHFGWKVILQSNECVHEYNIPLLQESYKQCKSASIFMKGYNTGFIHLDLWKNAV
jgi:hypothetical protein